MKREAMHRKGPLVAGACGLAAPLVGLSMVFTAVSRAPWFNWPTNALSDLGVGPTAPVFNYGLIAAGAIAVAFAVGVGRYIIGGRAGVACSGALLWACSSLVLIGLFPEDAGRVHYLVSVSFFVSLPVSMLLLALVLLLQDRRANRPSVLLTVVLALVAGAVWALPHDGVAIPEIVSSVCGSGWFVVFGLRLLRESSYS